MKNTCLFLFFTLLGVARLGAQESDTLYRNKLLALPFASYTPETRLMFGGVLNYQFKPRGAGPETRTSQLLTSAIYTLNGQLILEVMPIVILPRERWLFDGFYQYAFFPDRY